MEYTHTYTIDRPIRPHNVTEIMSLENAFNAVYIGISRYFLYAFVLYILRWKYDDLLCAERENTILSIERRIVYDADIKRARFIFFCTAVFMEHFRMQAIYGYKRKAVNLLTCFPLSHNIYYKLYELKVLRCAARWICVLFSLALYSSSGFPSTFNVNKYLNACVSSIITI